MLALQVAQKMDDLKSFLEKNGSDSLIVPIIDKFARLCVKGNNVNVHNQRILKNLEAHKVAIELLHLPFNKPLFFSVLQFLAAVPLFPASRCVLNSGIRMRAWCSSADNIGLGPTFGVTTSSAKTTPTTRAPCSSTWISF